MTAAIIPARGGSKRIPRKNIVTIGGKPLITHTLENLRASSAFSAIYVSTDCQETADIARNAGGIVHHLRPAEMSDDHTTIDAVMRYEIEANDLQDDWIAQVYATAILTPPRIFADAVRRVEAAPKDISFMMSLVPYPHPIQRAVALEEDGQVKMLSPENARRRTQDLAPRYHDAAQFVFGRQKAWRSGQIVWDSPTLGYPLALTEAADIDTPDDLEIAEALLHAQLSKPVEPT